MQLKVPSSETFIIYNVFVFYSFSVTKVKSEKSSGKKVGRKPGSKCRDPSDPSVDLLDCLACGKQYMTVKALWQHLESHHRSDASYTQVVMDTEYAMAKRRSKHPIDLECSLCQQKCAGNQVRGAERVQDV
jgi:hypothetical protein